MFQIPPGYKVEKINGDKWEEVHVIAFLPPVAVLDLKAKHQPEIAYEGKMTIVWALKSDENLTIYYDSFDSDEQLFRLAPV